MKKARFICRHCGNRFATDVLEPGEAEEKRIRPVPVRCPQCGSTNVEQN
ncbi:hypothetical protein KA005_55740 [bacterium]|nr:hypothetical protein [bacterium]